MYIKTVMIFLFLFFIQGFSRIPSSLKERDEECKKMLHKAAFGDVSYKKKIEIYDDLLSIIAFGVNHTVQKKYISGPKKLFIAREKNNTHNNILLEKLFARALTINQLNTASSLVQAWLVTLTNENKDQALSTKNIISLYFPQARGYLYAKKNNNSITFQSTFFTKEADQFQQPSILFSFDSQQEDILKNGNSYNIIPLYVQENKEIFPLNQKKSLKLTFKKNNSGFQNIYNNDLVQLFFDHPSQGDQLHKTWAKIELQSEEQRHTIENDYLTQKIKHVDFDTSSEEVINIIDAQAQCFTENTVKAK